MTVNNDTIKTITMWGLSAISALLLMMWTELKSDVKELQSHQLKMMSERFTPEDAVSMENRLGKMVEASIAENRNSLATLRSEMNGKLDIIIHTIRKGGME